MDLLSTRQQSGATMERLKHGLRFTDNGRNSYWVAYGSIDNNLVPESIEESWEDDIAGQRTFPEDPNYPVVHNYTMGHRYSRSMNDLRRDVQNGSSMAC
ncbi:AIF_collapsed_G0032150.mRNA.1.CDS.1 [Saccharomyces cerevisiae]|nr:AIF_collapsed_G0032150.mRNA.1.CDS.1 [Saccharomyces cerevisiae]